MENSLQIFCLPWLFISRFNEELSYFLILIPNFQALRESYRSCLSFQDVARVWIPPVSQVTILGSGFSTGFREAASGELWTENFPSEEAMPTEVTENRGILRQNRIRNLAY